MNPLKTCSGILHAHSGATLQDTRTRRTHQVRMYLQCNSKKKLDMRKGCCGDWFKSILTMRIQAFALVTLTSKSRQLSGIFGVFGAAAALRCSRRMCTSGCTWDLTWTYCPGHGSWGMDQVLRRLRRKFLLLNSTENRPKAQGSVNLPGARPPTPLRHMGQKPAFFRLTVFLHAKPAFAILTSFPEDIHDIHGRACIS